MKISDYTQQNRAAWDEIAAVRHKNSFPPAEFFRDGGSVLAKEVLSIAGPVAGLQVLHLQCSTGSETLSWAVHGAQATGVDISEKQVEIAQQTARIANLPVTFIAADIYDLPAEIMQGSFDIVYTGGGAIVFLPDLIPWAEAVAAALKPGGRLILVDEHPLAGCVEMVEGVLKINGDYFSREKPYEVYGWGHFKGGEEAQELKYEFNWPLGDVVTAIAQAGLVIELLRETPSQAEWRYGKLLHEVARLPGEYLLVARKPEFT